MFVCVYILICTSDFVRIDEEINTHNFRSSVSKKVYDLVSMIGRRKGINFEGRDCYSLDRRS